MISFINDSIAKLDEITGIEYLKYSFENPEYLIIKKENRFFCVKDKVVKNNFDNFYYELWQDLDASVIENIYYEYFCKQLDELIINLFLNKEKINETHIINFKNSFSSIEKNNYTILSKFYGISIREPKGIIELGNFKLCNYQYYMDNLKIKYRLEETSFEKEPQGEIDNCFIVKENINAIDKKKAEMFFYNKVEQFINLLLYSLGNCSEKNSLISYKDENIMTKVAIIDVGSGNWSIPSSNKSIINPLYYLDQDFFNKRNYTNLFLNLDANNLCKLEKRVMRAIDWFGLSMRNNNLQQRYTFASIALESLLSRKTDGIMDQSITSRLREYSAFLYSEDKQERKKVYDDLSKLYTHRSKISHSGISNDLKYKDYMRLLEILSVVIKNVRTLINIGICDDEQLTNHINKIKGIC